MKGQNVQQKDLQIIANRVNSAMQGKEIGSGIRLRKCLATERTLIYNYEVPESWFPPPTIKQDLVKNFRTSGTIGFYRENQIDLEFYYYKGNRLIKKVEINNSSPDIVSRIPRFKWSSKR